MLRIIDFYALKHISKYILLSSFALILFAVTFNVFSNFDAGGLDRFWYQLLREIPFAVSDILPLGCLIGVVVAMQILINNNEMAVIRSLGISNKRSLVWVAIPAFCFGALSIVWDDYVAVPLYKYSQTQLSDNYAAEIDLWLNDGGKLVYLEGINWQTDYVSGEHKFSAKEINIFDASQPARFGKGWDLTLAPDNSLHIKEYLAWNDVLQDAEVRSVTGQVYPLGIEPQILLAQSQDTKAQDLGALWQSQKINRELGAKQALTLFELWTRYSRPVLFVALALLMLALCLVSSATRDSVVGLVVISIALGLFIGTVFKSVIFYVALAYADLTWLGAFLPPLVLAALAGGFILRSRV